MPVVVSNRRGLCAVCSLPIEPSEVITYERAVGARHMACADVEAARRRNLYAARCELCGVKLRRGEGRLAVVERQASDGTWRRSWRARCVEVHACDARIRATQ
ncbi:hypothetical protein [Myxococcus xanthus]|uniref:hypothetical protein n=1 Tax=Myxococcus xanthus TaxID=34 RepID=UPI001129E947|nr:hypothetical protein [Myxococcus xanthus]